VRFRVVPSGGEPFIHEQDKPLKAGDTFFHPPREPGTHGFFKVTAVESGDDETDSLVHVDRMDS
jgi:hypothetical protein